MGSKKLQGKINKLKKIKVKGNSIMHQMNTFLIYWYIYITTAVKIPTSKDQLFLRQ